MICAEAVKDTSTTELQRQHCALVWDLDKDKLTLTSLRPQCQCYFWSSLWFLTHKQCCAALLAPRAIYSCTEHSPTYLKKEKLQSFWSANLRICPFQQLFYASVLFWLPDWDVSLSQITFCTHSFILKCFNPDSISTLAQLTDVRYWDSSSNLH